MGKRTKRIRCAVIAVVVALACGLVASWIVAGALINPRPRKIGPPPADFPADSLSLESKSGSTIAGWHIRAEPSVGVIVLLHPIRGSRLSMLERAKFLYRHGYSIVMIDLQAHGESPGEHITIGHLERHDARAAVEYAREQHPNEPLTVIGVSLGGASALLASPLDIDALIIESVYPDINAAVHNRVTARLGSFAWLPAELLLVQLEPLIGVAPDQLRPIDKLHDVDCPIFVISGLEDAHTTAKETRQMFQSAIEPKQLWLVPEAEHVDLHALDPEEYERRVLDFLRKYARRIPVADATN